MKQSSWEKRAERLFKRKHIKYRKEFQAIPFRKYRVDFVIKIWIRNIWIEIDWSQHLTLKALIYDKIRDAKIKKKSWIKKIYRVGYNNLEKKLMRIILIEKIKTNLILIFRIIILIIIIIYLHKHFNFINIIK